MSKKSAFYSILLIAAVLLTSSPVHAAGWRFPVGITYASGFQDVVDLFEDNLRAQGYTITQEASSWPVGLTIQPYYQYDSGFGLGAGFGPMMIVSADPYFLFAAPVNLNVRYAFMPAADVSPYVRAGVSYFIASGDFAVESTPGPFGAVGVEFMRRSSVGAGIEASYDASTIKMERVSNDSTENIKPGAFMVMVFIVF